LYAQGTNPAAWMQVSPPVRAEVACKIALNVAASVPGVWPGSSTHASSSHTFRSNTNPRRAMRKSWFISV